MFSQIISLENLFIAWREFRRGKRNKLDVQIFERHLEDNLFALHNDLRNKVYRHGPYERFHIFDPKHRIIHKASVRDRVVHHAVYHVLAPILESSFIFDSYSCRIGKGTHKAVDRLEKFVRRVSHNYRGSCWALKCDIAKFFDSIDHRILLQMLAHSITDPSTFWLLREIIESFFVTDKFSERVRGIPLGNLTSQLFANFYLNSFDHFIKEKLKVRYYLRYTDDFVIVADNKPCFRNLIVLFDLFFRRKLALKLHPKKIIIRKFHQGIDFLGYIILPYHRLVRTKTKKRIFRKIRWRVYECRRGFIACRTLEQSFKSFLGVFSHADTYNLVRQLKGMSGFSY